jgi:hypothetical protein
MEKWSNNHASEDVYATKLAGQFMVYNLKRKQECLRIISNKTKGEN